MLDIPLVNAPCGYLRLRPSFICSERRPVAKRILIKNPAHHFVKHCKNRELIREHETGAIIGIHPEAFLLRPADSKYPEEKWLSGLYYEAFDGTHSEKMRASCHFIPIEMKRKDALCRMNVGQ